MTGLLGRKKGATIASTGTEAAESYRRLRTMVDVVATDHPGVRMVASPDAGEGTTTMVANLGVALASPQRPVLLIDGNLYRPALHTMFGLPNDVGLTSVASGAVSLAEAIQPVPAHPGVHVLAAGPAVDDPAGFLSGPAVESLFLEAAASAPVVFVDGPPLLPVAGGVVLAGLSAGVVVVVRAGKTSQADLASAVDLVEHRGTPVLGVVLNGVRGESRRFFGRGRTSYADGRAVKLSAPVSRAAGTHTAPPRPAGESRPAQAKAVRAEVTQ